MPILRLILIPVGLFLLIVGLIVAPSPVPIGLPMAAIGLFLLLASSRTARRIFKGLRARIGWLDNAMRFVESKTGGRLKRTLEKSRPEATNTDSED